MENASKALIIAGAILLAILLISLGIMIFTQAQDTVSNSGMSEAEAQSFNSKFTKYEGDIKGTMVKSLVQEVLSNNGNENNAERKIKMKGTDIGCTDYSETPTTSGIKNNKTYTVKMEYATTGGTSTSSGRIYQITVD